jgi:hypothetical protein
MACTAATPMAVMLHWRSRRRPCAPCDISLQVAFSKLDFLCFDGLFVFKPNLAAPGSSGVVPDAAVAPVSGQPVLVSGRDDVTGINDPPILSGLSTRIRPWHII